MPTTEARRRRKVAGHILSNGKCNGEHSKDGSHEVWIGMTGDMLPYFCVNGCRKWSSERPPHITDNDMRASYEGQGDRGCGHHQSSRLRHRLP